MVGKRRHSVLTDPENEGTDQMRESRQARQQQLAELVRKEPFLTDAELAERLGVSVPTVRLDRLALGIPEVRQRTARLAQEAYGLVRSLGAGEVVGYPMELALGRRGTSVLDTDDGMAFARTGIVRGHYLFAQANSLAVALIDAPVALTASAAVRFLRPVRAGDRVVADATVISRNEARRGARYVVNVVSAVKEVEVFRGKFSVHALTREDDWHGSS